MEKLLTISIAAYNVQSYLAQCLDSLLIPSMDKLEVLIENDGSKDNTAAIAKEYEEKYPGVFRLVDKENGGYGSTINNSIRIATGKYFKQLDGDDWYHTEHLEQLVCQLENADVDCVFSPFMEVYEADGKQILRPDNALTGGVYALEDIISQAWFLQMHALAFRTELLREHNVTILEHCFYTDQEYVLYPLLHCVSVLVYPEYVYCYRMGQEGQSVSIEGWKKRNAEHERVIRQLLTRYDELCACHSVVRDCLLNRLQDLINWQYKLYMVLGDKKAELKALDIFLRKNYPAIYKRHLYVGGRRLLLIRLSGFMLYDLLRDKNL